MVPMVSHHHITLSAVVAFVATLSSSGVAVNGFGIAPPNAVQPLSALHKLSPVRTYARGVPHHP